MDKSFLSTFTDNSDSTYRSPSRIKTGSMKNFWSGVASYGIAVPSVFQMKNFDPTTLAFWETIVGMLVFIIVLGTALWLVQENMKEFKGRIISKFRKKWNGTGGSTLLKS